MGSKPNSEKNRRSNSSPAEQKRALVAQLEAAGLNTERFINVRNGTKRSFNHTRRRPGDVAGNYGVYTGGGLLALDIDDLAAWSATSGSETVPPTFRVATPHDGQHRYYRATAEVECLIQAACAGRQNPSLEWGELYASKYLVGPGSKLVGCTDSGCDGCYSNTPGRYTIEANQPIAEISSSDVIRLLTSMEGKDSRQSSVIEFNDWGPTFRDLETDSQVPHARPKKPAFQLKLGADKPRYPEDRVVFGIVRSQNRVLEGDGVEFGTVLDEAEKQGLDCWRTARAVRRLLKSGALRRGDDPNQIIPKAEGVKR